ncbi:hypothetical protein AALB52_24205 [Lachnospiraceae bacterium 38-14]|jgi:hypothetical protein
MKADIKLGLKIVGLVIGVFFLLILGFIGFWMYDSRDRTEDIGKYQEYIGKDGKYKENFDLYNDIFPDSIDKNVCEVEDFCYYYYNPWDPCYLGYLVYTCDEEFFEKEYQRLKELDSSEEPYPYGIKNFPYELCAVYTNRDYGFIYALADREQKKFAYVELQFCNGFTDIKYEKIIDAQYLPEGMDIKISYEE